MSASTANQDLVLGRQFRSGLKFRTLCKSCNNGLGGREDKAIADFFARVRNIAESPLILSELIRVPAKPNLIYRGLLAHLVSANDNGVPSAFDLEARNIFFGKQSMRTGSWSLFYWIYTGPDVFVMRNAYYTLWHPKVEVIPIQIIKIYPLAFMFIQRARFGGFPNVLSFTRNRDEEEFSLPIFTRIRNRMTKWPIVVSPKNLIMMAGNTAGFIGSRD